MEGSLHEHSDFRTHSSTMMTRRVELLLILTACCAPQTHFSTGAPVQFQPTARIDIVKIESNGITAIDRYRWMEVPNSNDFQTWARQQNAYTRATLDRLPQRAELLQRLTTLSAHSDEVDSLKIRAQRQFYLKRPAADDVFKLYMSDGLDGHEQLLIDPKIFSKTEYTSIDFYEPSPDGLRVAFGISSHGSEDSVLHVIDVDNGQLLSDAIDRARHAEPRWTPDGNAFFYRRNPEVSPGAPISAKYARSRDYLHTIGGRPENDPPVFGFDISPRVRLATADSPYVFLWPNCPYVFGMVQHGTSNDLSIYVAPLASVDGARTPWRQLADVEDQVLDLAVHGSDVFLLTHRETPRAKVIRTRLDAPDITHAETIVAASEVVLSELAAGSDALYVRSLKDGIGRIIRVPFDATPRTSVPLPVDGTISGFAANPAAPGCSFQLESWVEPRAYYLYHPAEHRAIKLRIVQSSSEPLSVVLEAVETKVTSADGTQVPLSIVYRRGIDRTRSHPTLLVGYGAYGIPMSSWYEPRLSAWIERGGIYAIAHVRGGGEYGEEWHLAGMKHNKQRSVDDFIACARFLIAHGYTSTRELAAWGVSAGALTVGSAVTQQPKLFAAAVLRVGITDALRFETTPLGPQNAREFGSSAVPTELTSLYDMSPYYHVRDGEQYPAVLLTAAAHDARVPAWQPGKMAARLQSATSSGHPILFRLDSESGHGYGLGTTNSQLNEELADCYAFLLWQLTNPVMKHR